MLYNWCVTLVWVFIKLLNYVFGYFGLVYNSSNDLDNNALIMLFYHASAAKFT